MNNPFFGNGLRFQVKARETVDFAPGLSLGEFRRRVEALAKAD